MVVGTDQIWESKARPTHAHTMKQPPDSSEQARQGRAEERSSLGSGEKGKKKGPVKSNQASHASGVKARWPWPWDTDDVHH